MQKQTSVLLVDDDPTFNFITETLLKSLQLTKSIDCVKNGQEALNVIKDCSTTQNSEKCPDIIFLDLNMPVMNGFEFLQEYKERYSELKKNIQIYVLTSSINPKDREKIKEYPIAGYLCKPLDKETLKNILSN